MVKIECFNGEKKMNERKKDAVCVFTDCKYKDTEGCRVKGLGVSGITSCVKYKVFVPLTSRRKVNGGVN